MSFNELFLMIFVIVLIFTLKKIKSIYEMRKRITGEVQKIELRGRRILLLLSLFLVGFGSVYAFQTRDLYSVVYVLIGIAYSVVAMDKLFVSDEAICYDGKYIEFKNIKKWVSIGNKFIEIVHTTNNKEETSLIPLDSNNILTISEIIKNRKGSKHKNKGKK